MTMGNVTIFEEPSGLPTVRRQSRVLEKMSGGMSLRRIQTNNTGTFKRIVGGKQVGKAVPHALDIIIVDFLRDVSRKFYAAAYNPDAKPTLPDCWSNLGDRPEAKAPNKQAANCKACSKNVDGSGPNGKSRACRFERRIAILIAGDPSGEVYQMTVAASSLFGDGADNEHPFESYKNFLRANGEAPDTVVTRVMYDLEADTPKLKFKAIRHLTELEAGLVDAAQDDPMTQNYVQLTVAEADGVDDAPAAQKVIEAKATPVKTANPFEDGDDEEEPAPAPKARTKKAPAANPFESEDEVDAPAVRSVKKAKVVEVKPELAGALDDFLSDDED
jgi:hypothetical protein